MKTGVKWLCEGENLDSKALYYIIDVVLYEEKTLIYNISSFRKFIISFSLDLGLIATNQL